MTTLHRCHDCGVDTAEIGEYPLMVHYKLWRLITLSDATGIMLCRADMERRLGRSLTDVDRRQPWWEVDDLTRHIS